VKPFNYDVPLARLMLWTHGGDYVDTPLHPAARTYRRNLIVEEGYRKRNEILKAQEQYMEQVANGFYTVNEARRRCYGD
jgi:hypothetical protein